MFCGQTGLDRVFSDGRNFRMTRSETHTGKDCLIARKTQGGY